MKRLFSSRPSLSTSITIASIGVFLLLLLLFNLRADFKKPDDYPEGVSYEKAVVVAITADSILQDPEYPDISIGRQDIVLRVTSGAHKGKLVATYNLVERILNNPARVGTKYIISSYDDFITASVVDYNREGIVYGMLALFALVVLVLGRKKGVASLFSLAFTLVCIIFLFIPLVVLGWSAILAAGLVVALSSAVTLWSLNGWGLKTLCALASCTACTLLAGLLAYGIGAIARIDTMNTLEAEDLLFVMRGTGVSVRHLLFAGILFASLGAIMDTAMSITSSIFEIREISPGFSQRQLHRSGMNIGRDIMGTMTNTLILAFVGSSVNLVLIYYMYSVPGIRLLNMPFVVAELIQGLSASTALVLSIPVASWVASTVCSRVKMEGKQTTKHKQMVKPAASTARRATNSL